MLVTRPDGVVKTMVPAGETRAALLFLARRRCRELLDRAHAPKQLTHAETGEID